MASLPLFKTLTTAPAPPGPGPADSMPELPSRHGQDSGAGSFEDAISSRLKRDVPAARADAKSVPTPKAATRGATDPRPAQIPSGADARPGTSGSVDTKPDAKSGKTLSTAATRNPRPAGAAPAPQSGDAGTKAPDAAAPATAAAKDSVPTAQSTSEDSSPAEATDAVTSPEPSAVVAGEALQALLLAANALVPTVPVPLPTATASGPSDLAVGAVAADGKPAATPVPSVSFGGPANSTWTVTDARQIEQAGTSSGSELPSVPAPAPAAVPTWASPSVPAPENPGDAPRTAEPTGTKTPAKGLQPVAPAVAQPVAPATPAPVSQDLVAQLDSSATPAALAGAALTSSASLGRGTSAALRESAMQTETTTTPVGTKALASGDASVVPVGVEAQRDSGQSSSFGRQRDPQSGSGGSRDVVPDAALASATSSSAMRAQTDSLGSVDSARPAGLSVDSVASLRDEILSKVVEFRNQTPTSMTVILRPDPGTEMSISLRSTDGRIDVHVRLERGDASTLHESWSGLQQSLSQHGVNLMGLETAPLPSLPKAAEHRVDATASATGVAPGGVDARLAAASAMSFNTGDPQQRDSSPRSGGQDGQQQGGSGLFDGRQGGAGQQGLFQSRQDEPGGLPAFRNSPGLPSRGGSSAASGVPAGAGLAESAEPGAPWESWA